MCGKTYQEGYAPSADKSEAKGERHHTDAKSKNDYFKHAMRAAENDVNCSVSAILGWYRLRDNQYRSRREREASSIDVLGPLRLYMGLMHYLSRLHLHLILYSELRIAVQQFIYNIYITLFNTYTSFIFNLLRMNLSTEIHLQLHRSRLHNKKKLDLFET